MYVQSTLLKNCLSFYLAKYTVTCRLYNTTVFCNYNWYVSIWSIKVVSPLTTRISVFFSFPARRPWRSNSPNFQRFLSQLNTESHNAWRFHELIVGFFSRRELGPPVVMFARIAQYLGSEGTWWFDKLYLCYALQ